MRLNHRICSRPDAEDTSHLQALGSRWNCDAPSSNLRAPGCRGQLHAQSPNLRASGCRRNSDVRGSIPRTLDVGATTMLDQLVCGRRCLGTIDVQPSNRRISRSRGNQDVQPSSLRAPRSSGQPRYQTIESARAGISRQHRCSIIEPASALVPRQHRCSTIETAFPRTRGYAKVPRGPPPGRDDARLRGPRRTWWTIWMRGTSGVRPTSRCCRPRFARRQTGKPFGRRSARSRRAANHLSLGR